MGKAMKIWLIIATILIVLGGILFVIGMTGKKWDFSKLSTEKYETNFSLVSEEFKHISIKVETADISLVPVEDNICKVVFYEHEKVKHLATVNDETLTISVVDQRQWYDYIGISVSSPKIIIYLPEKDYASLNIKGTTGNVEILNDIRTENVDISISTGSITLQNLIVDNMNLSVSTGDIKVSSVECEEEVKLKGETGKTTLSGIKCGSLYSKASTGKIILSNVMVTDVFSVERSTGDVKFEGCDAGEIQIKTSTGKVAGSLLSEKIFFAQTSTGKINVPKTTTGGKCEINTSTGDIKVEIITADGTVSDVTTEVTNLSEN